MGPWEDLWSWNAPSELSQIDQGGWEFFCLQQPGTGKNGLLLEGGVILGKLAPCGSGQWPERATMVCSVTDISRPRDGMSALKRDLGHVAGYLLHPLLEEGLPLPGSPPAKCT